MKSIEQKSKEFTNLMEQNGFRYTGKTTYDGKFIFEREWKKIVDIAWYGETEISYRIEAYHTIGYPIIRIFRDGREIDCRDYSSPKHAINAIREIVRFASFEF